MNQDMYRSKCPACQRTLDCCNCDIGIVPERVLNFNWGVGNGSNQQMANPNRSGTKRSRTCPDFTAPVPMDCPTTDSSGDTKRRILQHSQSHAGMAPTPQQMQHQQQMQMQQQQMQMQQQQQQRLLQQIPNISQMQQQQQPNHGAPQQNPHMQNFNAKIPDTGFLFKH